MLKRLLMPAKRILKLFLVLSVGYLAYLVYQAHSVDFIREATVKVTRVGQEGNGSGVCISPTRVLTAEHVVDGNQMLINGKEARVYRTSKKYDLALLTVPGLDCKPIKLASSLPSVDEAIAIVGFPVNSRVKAQYVTYGHVQGNLPEDFRTATSAPVFLGNSGGGMFTRTVLGWRLNGILVEGYGHCSLFGGCSFISHLSRVVDVETIKLFMVND